MGPGKRGPEERTEAYVSKDPDCRDCLVRSGDQPTTLRTYGDKLYWSTYLGISRCTPSSCTSPEHLVTMSGGISELADASGFYWLAGADNTVYSCPITGCTAGGIKLGTAGSGAGTLRVGGNYIYWIAANVIYRLPKL